MIVRVEFFVDGGIFEPKIGAEVDHLATLLDERQGKFSGDTVRQREKDHLRLPGQEIGIRFRKAQVFRLRIMAEPGKDLRETLPRVLARCDRGQFGVRMRQEQAHEFLAGITRRADNPNLYRTSIHCLNNMFPRPAKLSTKSE